MGGAPHEPAERVLRSETKFAGKLLTLRVDQVALPNGRETAREIVEHPGAVGIVPLIDADHVVLVRQYRHAAGRALLEIPAGTLDRPGEALEEAAARELAEETGYHATRFVPLVSFLTAPGFATEVMTLFLATGLRDGVASPMEDEQLSVEIVPLATVPALIARGELADAKTLVGLLLARDQSVGLAR